MIVNNSNITDIYPHFKDIKERIAKLTVWNLDGTTQEMRFTYPPFCWNGDCSNFIGQHLEEWAREMTRYYLKITAYQVHFGASYHDGTEHFDIYFEKKEVPLNKIFIRKRIAQGKWHTPEFVEKKQNKARVAYLMNNMSQGKQAMSGQKVKSKPTRSTGWLN